MSIGRLDKYDKQYPFYIISCMLLTLGHTFSGLFSGGGDKHWTHLIILNNMLATRMYHMQLANATLSKRFCNLRVSFVLIKI